MGELNQKLSQVEAKNSVAKQTNLLLSKRLVDIERQTPSLPEESILRWWVFLTVFIIMN